MKMRKPNLENNVCPLCCHTLRRNGKTKTGKLRFRCICGFNETVNSTAHNSNIRTAYGYSKQLEKRRLRSYTYYHAPRPQKCSICSSTEKVENHHFDYERPLFVYPLCSNCHKLMTELIEDLEKDPLNPELTYLLFNHDSNVQFVNLSKSLRVNDCYALVSPTKENRALKLLTEC